MPRKDAAAVVRVGIEPGFKDDGRLPLLYELNQNQPLPTIIKDVCSRWCLDIPEQYALQYADTNKFITESNRQELKQGCVLRLTFSHTHASIEIANSLKSVNMETMKKALEKLVTMSEDASFGAEFIKQDGMKHLIRVVEGGTDSSEILANCLTSTQELLEHGILPWETISIKFIKKVTVHVNKTSPVDPTVLKRSLAILDSAVSNSPSLFATVKEDVTFENVIKHIESSHQEIQLNAMSLINSLLLKTDPSGRKGVLDALSSKGLRGMILNQVIQGGKGVSSEMAHQLYIYQCLKLSLLKDTMMKHFDMQCETDIMNLEKLRKIAFAMNVPTPRPMSNMGTTKDFGRLGFMNVNNPSEDLMETPPGILSLQCMLYFANNHQEKYNKVVFENLGRGDEHQCPFARASIALIKMLISLLGVGETITETSQNYQPMFFTTDSPFEEFYCVCIQVAYKTWKEMRATQEDFKGVLEVVKEQIQRGLSSLEKHSTLEMFKNHIFQKLDYNKIMEKRITDGDKQDRDGLNSKPVLELKQNILPEVIDLVRQQRLVQLVEGRNFSKKPGHGGRGKYFYCRLSPNHRFLHYGDCEENIVLPLDALPNKVAVSEIKALVTGTDCPHMKERTRTRLELAGRAFSLFLENNEDIQLNFIAPDLHVYSVWIDGLNSLLGNEMPSDEAQKDIETLLNMDLKLRLLDLLDLNIKIPDTAPEIPPPPPNFDFFYPDVSSL